MLSRFGVMFFGDPEAAFANIAGGLRPGGRAAFVVAADGGGNEWIQALSGLHDLLPLGGFGADGPGMFSGGGGTRRTPPRSSWGPVPAAICWARSTRRRASGPGARWRTSCAGTSGTARSGSAASPGWSPQSARRGRPPRALP
ncbi:hypothetical protein ACWGI0_26685 [Streptomyces sp. NPDC054802]